MKKSAFGLMASAVILLSACANFDEEVQTSGSQVVNHYPKYEQKEVTLFDLGRSLSNNRVDIYDPAAATLTVPPEQPKIENPLSRFPPHTSMLIKDEDVVVYSLFSNQDNLLDENLQPPDEIMAPPLPLNSDESLLPP